MRHKTWREKATSEAITRKVTRRKDPVTTYTELAREFGAPVYSNYSGGGGPATSSSFRAHITSTVGRIF